MSIVGVATISSDGSEFRIVTAPLQTTGHVVAGQFLNCNRADDCPLCHPASETDVATEQRWIVGCLMPNTGTYELRQLTWRQFSNVQQLIR